MNIELWAVRLERKMTEQEEKKALSLLPPARRERLDRNRCLTKRQEPLCAYATLWKVLWMKYRWRSLPSIALSQFGKPYFPDFPHVQFNLSHTDGAVLVGLSRRPIGVDIEKIRSISGRAARRLTGDVDKTEFFQHWVCREARAKRKGQSASALLEPDSPLRAGESYYPLDVFAGYAAGTAVDSGDGYVLQRCSLTWLFQNN